MFQEIYDEDYLDFYDSVKCLGDLGEKCCNFRWRIYNIQLYPLKIFRSPAFTTRLLPNVYWCLEIELHSPGHLKAMTISLRCLQRDKKLHLIVDVIYKVDFQHAFAVSSKFVVIIGNENTLNENTLNENILNENTLNERSNFSVRFTKPPKEYVTVECILRPNKQMINDVLHSNKDPSLSVDLRKLLKSGELYDTVIEVGNQKLKAHKAIISERLRNSLPLTATEQEQGKDLIKINDLPISVVKEMLKYAYTGQACVDFEAECVNKDVLVKYSQAFYQRCFWEDNPCATTFFNYETDSITWNLEGFTTAMKIGTKRINLLRIYPSEIELSLDVEEFEEGKWLTLSFKFCREEMPKSTIISYNCFLENGKTQETCLLSVGEILLCSNNTQAKRDLCSLLLVKRIKSLLCARNICFNFKVDLKICYGSSKSSIENMYNGYFDISQCTSCATLSSDMAYLINGHTFF